MNPTINASHEPPCSCDAASIAPSDHLSSSSRHPHGDSYLIRPARHGDEACIASLTHQIAATEGHPDWCRITPEQVRTHILTDRWAEVLVAVRTSSSVTHLPHEDESPSQQHSSSVPLQQSARCHPSADGGGDHDMRAAYMDNQHTECTISPHHSSAHLHETTPPNTPSLEHLASAHTACELAETLSSHHQHEADELWQSVYPLPSHASYRDGLYNEAGEHVLGMVMFYRGIGSYEGTPMFFIENLVVDQTMRSCGIGAVLFEKLEAYARHLGVQVISWECAHSNPAARRFYEQKLNGEIDTDYMMFRKSLAPRAKDR